MKRSFLLSNPKVTGLIISGTGLIAATYGLVRLAYGLFLPDVQAALSFDAAAAGLISSGASLLYCIGAVIGFFSAERWSRLLVIVAGLSASVGAAGMATAHSTELFALFAIAGSAGAGLASPALVNIVRRNVPATALSRSQVIVNSGTGPGLIGAGILALVLLPDWRTAWLVVAVFTVGVTAATLALDRGSESGGTPAGRPARSRLPAMSWFTDHRKLIVAAFFLGAGSSAVWNYGRTLLIDAGSTERTSIIAWVALGVGGTAAIITARVLSALEPRLAWIITTLAVGAATGVLALAAGSTAGSLVACAVFGWGYTAGTGALISWTTRVDAARAAAGTALLFVVLVLGQAAGASAIGMLITAAGFVPALLVATAITLLAAVTPLWRDTPRSNPRRTPHAATRR
ncbi:MAG: hypothetical protein JWQ43_3759 [Glaciihabitans sp.]|nr:hypothetical protein [Glaciihabitans sp.]